METRALRAESGVGPFPNPPRGAWRLLRGAILLAAGWIFVTVSLVLTSLFVLLTLRIGLDRYLHRVTRFVAGGVLRLGGIHLRMKGGERIAERRMRLISLNHSSQLDLFIIAAILPPGGTGIAKREIYRIPVLGLAFFAFDVPTVDRDDAEAARLSLAAAAERIRRRRASVFVAPEGTRSPDGRLGPFKMGLFHLAAQTGAPIVPLVIRGAARCQPRGAILPIPGVVEVELLPEIDTTGWSEVDLHDKRDELRALYQAALGETSAVDVPAPGSR